MDEVGRPVGDEMGEGVALHLLLPQNVARLSERHYGLVHLINCHNLHQPYKQLLKVLMVQ